jgi:hypothetical protein
VPASANVRDLVTSRMYVVRPGGVVVAPASGAVETVSSSYVTLRHYGGGLSRISMSGGSFSVHVGDLIAAGAPIPTTAREGAVLQVIWRFSRPNADGTSTSVPIKEALAQTAP